MNLQDPVLWVVGICAVAVMLFLGTLVFDRALGLSMRWSEWRQRKIKPGLWSTESYPAVPAASAAPSRFRRVLPGRTRSGRLRVGIVKPSTHGEKLMVNAFRVLTLGELDVVQKELNADVLVLRLEEDEMRFRAGTVGVEGRVGFQVAGVEVCGGYGG